MVASSNQWWSQYMSPPCPANFLNSIILVSLILHLNKEPYWITCLSFILARCLTLVTLVKSVVHLTKQGGGGGSGKAQICMMLFPNDIFYGGSFYNFKKFVELWLADKKGRFFCCLQKLHCSIILLDIFFRHKTRQTTNDFFTNCK